MLVFRIIPGVLWLDVLDKVTDQCQTFLGWRLPCSLLVLFLWMSFLGELRIKAVEAVKYINVVYYRPNKVTIKKFFGQWQARLGMCSVVCGLSYYITFEMVEDFPYLQQLRESILNERYNQDIKEVEDREVFLMSHVFIQRLLQQAQDIVWVLGTFLQLKRKRFYMLSGVVWALKPLGSLLVSWCGNFALWMLIGHTLLRAFDLAPEGHPHMGSIGCYTGVVASTIFWKKYGTMEIIVTVCTAIGAEVNWRNMQLLWRHMVKQLQDENAKREEKGKKGILDRAWSALTDLVTSEDEAEDTASKDKDDKSSEVEDIPYTHPSFYSWLAIVVYWAAVGIRMDGYDLTTL